MIRRPPISTLSSSSAASDVYKRQRSACETVRPVSAACILGVIAFAIQIVWPCCPTLVAFAPSRPVHIPAAATCTFGSQQQGSLHPSFAQSQSPSFITGSGREPAGLSSRSRLRLRDRDRCRLRLLSRRGDLSRCWRSSRSSGKCQEVSFVWSLKK
eukprot:TRINITY_DN27976_c0_g1_i1.p1 TRINITY_DN27976_c0_g1~~TRINITY_DN27976_c0_g1_i1.p1  ORF type:complete len:156 (+),score=4.59 TRINITY_DN27976_c0_g1_i1:89-556(+)